MGDLKQNKIKGKSDADQFKKIKECYGEQTASGFECNKQSPRYATDKYILQD
jgi:hypothetical protein